MSDRHGFGCPAGVVAMSLPVGALQVCAPVAGLAAPSWWAPPMPATGMSGCVWGMALTPGSQDRLWSERMGLTARLTPLSLSRITMLCR